MVGQVLQVKSPAEHQTKDADYFTLQVGAGLAKWYRLNKSQLGHFTTADVPPKEKVVEFRVSPNAVLPVGTELVVTHFVVGQYVDVHAVTKAKVGPPSTSSCSIGRAPPVS